MPTHITTCILRHWTMEI